MGVKARNLSAVVRNYLAARGWFTWAGGSIGAHNEYGTYFCCGEKGSPDLFAMRRCSVLFERQHDEYNLLAIELKAGRDTQSKSQKLWQAKWESAKGTYLIIHDVDDLVKLGI